MARVAVLLLFVALAVAACGSSSHPKRAAAAKPKVCKARAAAIAKINDDIAALQEAAKGSATDKATDKFLLDVSTAPITNLMRNRLIDHAAAAVTTKCPQCFLAMESERPIPSIAHVGAGSCSAS